MLQHSVAGGGGPDRDRFPASVRSFCVDNKVANGGPARCLVHDLNSLGFTNWSLRVQVSHLLSRDYSVNQASCDLARLRLNGLIQRRLLTNTYQLTQTGHVPRSSTPRSRTDCCDSHPDQPPAPAELRNAPRVIDRHVNDCADHSRLQAATAGIAVDPQSSMTVISR